MELWREVLAVNLDATFYLCKEVIPDMLAQGRGSIIAIGGLGRLRNQCRQGPRGGVQGRAHGPHPGPGAGVRR